MGCLARKRQWRPFLQDCRSLRGVAAVAIVKHQAGQQVAASLHALSSGHDDALCGATRFGPKRTDCRLTETLERGQDITERVGPVYQGHAPLVLQRHPGACQGGQETRLAIEVCCSLDRIGRRPVPERIMKRWIDRNLIEAAMPTLGQRNIVALLNREAIGEAVCQGVLSGKRCQSRLLLDADHLQLRLPSKQAESHRADTTPEIEHPLSRPERQSSGEKNTVHCHTVAGPWLPEKKAATQEAVLCYLLGMRVGACLFCLSSTHVAAYQKEGSLKLSPAASSKLLADS